MTAKQMREHAYSIALANRVVLIEEAELAAKPEGACVVKTGSGNFMALVPPIIGDTHYVVALHELGHVGANAWYGPHADASYKLLCERRAWEWARANAKDWTVAMEQVYVYAISTYETLWRMTELQRLARPRKESIQDFVRRTKP